MAGDFITFDEYEEAITLVQYQTNVLTQEKIAQADTRGYPQLSRWKQATENARQSWEKGSA